MAKKARKRELEGKAPTTNDKVELKKASERAILHLTGKHTVEDTRAPTFRRRKRRLQYIRNGVRRTKTHVHDAFRAPRVPNRVHIATQVTRVLIVDRPAQ